MSDIRAVENGSAVRVREELPGIVPTHFCNACPAFFRAKDRFYLTARRENGVHGIAVWPHDERSVTVESSPDGLVVLFQDGASVLIPGYDFPVLLDDYFARQQRGELVSWARRRGFAIRLVPSGVGQARIRVQPSEPHFVLLVAKLWLRENWVRSIDDVVYALEAIGADPVIFGLPALHG